MKSLSVLRAIFAVTSLFLGASCCIAETALPRFKLGAIIAQTGPMSIMGVPLKNALILAKETLDTENRLLLIIEDDAFLPKNTVTATRKLLQEDAVDGLAVFGTNQGLAIADIVEGARKPFLSININPSVVKDRQYAVHVMPPIDALTAATVETARKRNIGRAAIIATLQDSCLLQRDIYARSGVSEIVESIEVAPTDTEVRESLQRVISKRPDGVFLSVLPPQGSLFSKRLRELGYKGEIFGGIQIAHRPEYVASNGALLGAWVVSGDDRNADEYRSLYRKKYGEDPTAESIFVYDAIGLLLEGLRSGDANRFLHEVKDFRGAIGTFSANGKNGFTLPVVAKEFTETGFRYLP